MGSKIFGAVSSIGKDLAGESLSIDGCENRITFIRDEHDELDSWHVLGTIDFSKKIRNEADCENPKQLKAWMKVQEPMIYAEGTLFDDEDHPNAKACASILRYCNNNETLLQPGWSIDGAIFERRDANGNVTEDKKTGKNLVRSVATSAAFTVNPCNPKMAGALWIEDNGLQKSYSVPSQYNDALKKSRSAHSFNETMTAEQAVLQKISQLKKSLADFNYAFTSVHCYRCGQGARFFKSGTIPNTCEKCGTHYTVKQIWDSVNK